LRPFRILSLDGGGVRGAFTASFLATLEEELGRPLVRHFDLLAGTSTGAIIALSLALGEPASTICRMYERRSAAIFVRQGTKVRKWWTPFVNMLLRRYDVDCDQLMQTKYDGVELRRALCDIFGERGLRDALTRVVVPAVDLTKGSTVVFKTPHLPGLTRDVHYSAVDIAMASAAAPTFFPHGTIGSGAYSDGGLWANNPSVIAYVEARRICQHNTGFDPEQVSILSVGTGEPASSLAPPDAMAGLGWWGPRLVDVMMLAQAQGTQHIAGFLVGVARHHRVNFRLPDRSWTLDEVGKVPQLIHIGQQEAHSQLARLKDAFFTTPTDPYRGLPAPTG
jgi:patatin-like phospholipase/acyl hydrolase